MKKLIFLLILFFPYITFSQKLAVEVKDTNSIQVANAPITESELDALEKHLQEDPNYKWKIAIGERQRTIDLILAAQKRKPASANLWNSLLELRFAQDQFDARSLPENERRERYRDALGYLQEFSQSVESEVKANPDNSVLKVEADLLKGSIALAALESGELDLAKNLAEEMLINNPDTSWNYGDVIYNANTILGRVALRQDDLQSAKMYLLESGKTPGSSILNSFGPSFILDRELLEKDEKGVVLKHLDQVSNFWKMDENFAANEELRNSNMNPAKKLEMWRQEIEEGKIPDDNKWK
jgi:tetratricopeptide (TPR) repeat protein